MSFPLFLRELFETGRARVPGLVGPESLGDGSSVLASVPADECEEAAEVLVAYERAVRGGWPLSPPVLAVETALRSAASMYLAARLVISRHVPGEIVTGLLAGGLAPDASPASHYAVDLTGRFLPDLFRLAGGTLGDDPLGDRLRGWAHDWPLSSVGVSGVEPSAERLAGVLAHPALRLAYADRVLGRGDTARLADAETAQAARDALGPHHDLAGAAMRQTLWPTQDQPAATTPRERTT